MANSNRLLAYRTVCLSLSNFVARDARIPPGYRPERVNRVDIADRPYALLAELTYRCPLHCPYCSNPVRAADKGELDTEQWTRVIQEAAALGVLQIGFSGGEPLQRRDLQALVRVAR